MKRYIEAGEFVTMHGIVGELKLYPWSDDPAFLTGFERIFLSADGKKQHKITSARGHKNVCLIKLEGVNSIEEARPFIGKTVWVAREDVELPDGRYFVQDMLGAAVQDADSGKMYGKITNITRPGKHEVFEITAEDEKVFLFPAVKPFLISLSVEEQLVMVRPIEGMFEEEESKSK